MSHPCRVPNCARNAKDGQLMCWPHWRQVPKALNRAIFHTYKWGPDADYQANVNEAVRVVVEKEGNMSTEARALPTIHETTFGGFVKTIYGYAEPGDAAAAGDDDVAEMIEWTSTDPKGPRIGWDERIHYWQNAYDREVLWRHRPTADDLDERGDIKPDAIARRGV